MRIILVCLCLVAVVGTAWAQSGMTAQVDSTRGMSTLTEAQRRELERIGTLGYTVGGDRAPERRGLTIREDAASEGYTVYVSADFSGAFLLDMNGNVLHTWHESTTKEWTRAWVYPDGSILGVTAYPARLVKMDADSNPIWMYGSIDLRAHHDVRVTDDGLIYALMRTGHQWAWYRDFPILSDMVCILEPEGESEREKTCLSIPKAFYESDYSDWVTSDEFLSKGCDPFHTNSLEVLDGTVPLPAFASGNILITVRNMDCIAVLDPDSESIVWANRGRWQRPHEARVTPDGHLLLFDNRRFDGQSRVVEYDVVNDEILWTYTKPGFYSVGRGAEQLLPNGDVLVTESQKGRILEITRDGTIVWEYCNPSTMNHGETIVAVPRAFRLPYDYFKGEFADYLSERRTR